MQHGHAEKGHAAFSSLILYTKFSAFIKCRKKAFRMVTKSNYLPHTNPIFEELKILPVPKLLTFTQLKLMHSIVHKYSPQSLYNIFLLNY
jgi:hypothetical protein